MRFKVDENLPAEIAELLRSAEHDATTVHEQRLMGEADPPVQHSGIVVLRVAR